MLQSGKILRAGPTEEVVKEYLAGAVQLDRQDLAIRQDRQGNGAVRFVSMELRDEDGDVVNGFVSGRQSHLRCYIENKSGRDLRRVNFAISIDNSLGSRITHLSTEYSGGDLDTMPADTRWIEARIPRLPFMPGRYRVTLFLAEAEGILDWVQDAAAFDVNPGDFFGNGKILYATQGDFMFEHQFVVGSNG